MLKLSLNQSLCPKLKHELLPYKLGSKNDRCGVATPQKPQKRSLHLTPIDRCQNVLGEGMPRQQPRWMAYYTHLIKLWITIPARE